MARLVSILLLSFSLNIVAVAQAAPNIDDPLDIALEGIADGKYYDGFETSTDLTRQSLPMGKSAAVYFTLDSTQEYDLVAACPLECKDLEIEVYDEKGIIVADAEFSVDLTDANIYDVEFSVPKTGKYKISYSMIDCTTPKCDVAAFIANKSK